MCSTTKKTEWGHWHAAPTVFPVTLVLSALGLPSLAYFLFSASLGSRLLSMPQLCTSDQLITLGLTV